ncbi:MAG: hypothetical protein WBF71_15750 [Microthrixaceae bacterium]
MSVQSETQLGSDEFLVATATVGSLTPDSSSPRGSKLMVGFKQRVLGDISSLGGFGRAWVIGNIAFSAGRALLAWPTLGKYGVNPVAFLALDLITAPPYGLAQAVTVKILRDPERRRSDAFGWGILVVALFVAPYVYIFAASGDLPVLAYVGVFVWMAIFGALAILRMRRDVAAGPLGGSA